MLLTILEGTPGSAPPLPPSYELQLRAEHDELERVFREVRLNARIGEWHECDRVWGRFSSQLERHMRFEEEAVLPRYERSSPAAARVSAGLREEHRGIRSALAQIGVDIELHCMRAETVERFLDELRDHVERERLSIYLWLLEMGPGAMLEPAELR